MERLTKKDFDMETNSTKFTDVLKSGATLYLALEKLKEYEDAEEQGLLVRLPDNKKLPRQGDVVYLSCKKFMRMKNFVLKLFVKSIEWNFEKHSTNGLIIHCKEFDVNQSWSFTLSDLGVKIFLTEAEALQALKEREGASE